MDCERVRTCFFLDLPPLTHHRKSSFIFNNLPVGCKLWARPTLFHNQKCELMPENALHFFLLSLVFPQLLGFIRPFGVIATEFTWLPVGKMRHFPHEAWMDNGWSDGHHSQVFISCFKKVWNGSSGLCMYHLSIRDKLLITPRFPLVESLHQGKGWGVIHIPNHPAPRLQYTERPNYSLHKPFLLNSLHFVTPEWSGRARIILQKQVRVVRMLWEHEKLQETWPHQFIQNCAWLTEDVI